MLSAQVALFALESLLVARFAAVRSNAAGNKKGSLGCLFLLHESNLLVFDFCLGAQILHESCDRFLLRTLTEIFLYVVKFWRLIVA
jgi:hypothetical protein